MMNQKPLQITFSGVFPTYIEWKNWTDNLGLYDVNHDDEELFNQWVYARLYERYSTIFIAYSDSDTFLQELANGILDHFKQYFLEKKFIDEVYNLEVEDFIKVVDSLRSVATNNNNTMLDPSQWVGYISNQEYNFTNNSKIEGYLLAISRMPSYNIDKFLRKFANFFETWY